MSTHAAVNVPSNDKIKEADINNKTQLYGIGQAFALGKAPSNKQIDVAMNSALAHKALSNPSKDLSADGRQLISDLRSVIEQAKVLFLTKNEGNLLQDFAWQCQQTGSNGAGIPGAPVDKDTAKQHGNEALEGLRTLGQLLITNGQFRKLIQDMSVLARDIAGDAAQNAANKINPSEDELNNIDEPAEDNTWHDSPDFQGMKNQASGLKSKIPFGSKGEAKESLKQNAQQSAEQAQSSHEQGGSAIGNLKSQAQDMANSNLSEEDKQKAEEKKQQAREKRDETKERTQNYLKEKVPKERREQAIYRLKKMIVEIQGHQDYQSAIDTLLRLAEEYKGHTKSVTNDAAANAKGAHSGNDGLNAAEADLRIVLERFANNTSMDDLFDSVNAIYRDADQDPELKGFFKHLDTYIRKCLKEQGFVLKDEATEQWNQLYDQGNFLLRDRYKNHTNRVLDEIKFFGQQFDNDPMNKRFGQSMNKLFQDLGTDKDGKPEFKPHLLRDLRDVIIPQIIEGIRYIPIPDIEFTSTDVDVVIRDLVVEADNILPNIVDITSDNHFRYGRKGVKSTNKNKFIVHVSGIQTDLTNIRFYSKAKKGIKLRNWGLMDVQLAKTGLDFKIHMETADKTDGAHFFKVSNVDVKISNLKINFREQHHPILTKVAALFAKGSLLSGPISKVLETQIKKAVSDADAFAYQIYQDVQKAKAEAKNNPENAQNVFKQYFDAYQQRLTRKKREGEKKKEQAKAKAAEKEVQTNIAFTKEQRISTAWNGGKGLPIDEQEKNPNSGSGRFTLKTHEYNKLARDGNKWESPVFSIGSAKESTNLPKVAAVSRKPHDATPSQLRSKEESRFGDSNKDFASAAAGGAGLGAAGVGAGYASQHGSSTGQQQFHSAGAGPEYVQPGYGAATGTGYGQGQGTPASLGQSTGTSGSAFNDTTYSQTNGNAVSNAINDKSGTAGQGDLGPSGAGNSSTYTTLGTNNPVLTGRV